MKQLLFILVWAFPLIASAQANFVYSGYTQCTWDEIALMDSSYRSTDSSIVFVSCRNRFNDPANPKEFLGTSVDTARTLHFYTLYFQGNSWRAVPHNTLADAIGRARFNGKDFLAYTEGDGKTFPDAVDRSTRLCRLYHVNIVMFDWPSRVAGYGGIKNVHNTVKNTFLAAPSFYSFLVLLQDYRKNHAPEIDHISLFLHSMGNAVFKNSLTNHSLSELGPGFIDNIILNAACVPVRHHRKWVESIHFASHIYVVYNRKDKTLRQASLLFGERLLGCQLSKPLAPNALYINVHPLAGNNHNCFLIIPLLNQQPDLCLFFDTLFHVKPLNTGNPAFLIPRKNGKGFSLL
ncbi:MAG TPA: alpha/beta hydrolase [Bacteroidia bacterium]|jgi:hypothetical protein|nr:alpha/beta hydrolase [Bacteroidia bacterium]